MNQASYMRFMGADTPESFLAEYEPESEAGTDHLNGEGEDDGYLELRQYPAAIAGEEITLIEYQGLKREADAQVAEIKASIEAEIAADPDLTNEQKRKAKRLELEGERMAGPLQHRQNLIQVIDRVEVALSRRKREFEVLKLEAQAKIASIEI